MANDGCAYGMFTRGALWTLVIIIGIALTGIAWYAVDTKDYADQLNTNLKLKVQQQDERTRYQEIMSTRLDTRIETIQRDIAEIKESLGNLNKVPNQWPDYQQKQND